MKKEGKIPVNARIDIDYSKEKPKIKFGYPRKDAYEQNKYGIHTIILCFLLCYPPLLFLDFYSFEKPYPNNVKRPKG